MSRYAPKIDLTPEEREALLHWSRAAKVQRRYADRARIVLEAATGMENKAIAAKLRTSQVTVSKWRSRFVAQRLEGLDDKPRPGAKPKYDQNTDKRVLALLDQPPPKGYTHSTPPSCFPPTKAR